MFNDYNSTPASHHFHGWVSNLSIQNAKKHVQWATHIVWVPCVLVHLVFFGFWRERDERVLRVKERVKGK
jgi:hypothetical protein